MLRILQTAFAHEEEIWMLDYTECWQMVFGGDTEKRVDDEWLIAMGKYLDVIKSLDVSLDLSEEEEEGVGEEENEKARVDKILNGINLEELKREDRKTWDFEKLAKEGGEAAEWAKKWLYELAGHEKEKALVMSKVKAVKKGLKKVKEQMVRTKQEEEDEKWWYSEWKPGMSWSDDSSEEEEGQEEEEDRKLTVEEKQKMDQSETVQQEAKRRINDGEVELGDITDPKIQEQVLDIFLAQEREWLIKKEKEEELEEEQEEEDIEESDEERIINLNEDIDEGIMRV